MKVYPLHALSIIGTYQTITLEEAVRMGEVVALFHNNKRLFIGRYGDPIIELDHYFIPYGNYAVIQSTLEEFDTHIETLRTHPLFTLRIDLPILIETGKDVKFYFPIK